MRNRLFKLALLAFLLPFGIVASSASVPPPGFKRSAWNGPGLFCGYPFTITLKANERLIQNWPNTTSGYFPYDVRLENGSFIIPARKFNKPAYLGKRLVKRVAGGKLVKFDGLREAYGGRFRIAGYVFLPKDKEDETIEFINFDMYELLPNAEFEAAMKRFMFRQDEPPNCLEMKKIDPGT